MKRKYKKLFGLLISFFMVVSIAFTTPIRAVAAEQPSSTAQSLEKAKQIYLDNMKKTRSLKPSPAFNDNLPRSITYSPDENVRVIVELDEKAVKDYSIGTPLSQAAKDTTLQKKVKDVQAAYKDKVRKIDSSVNFRKNYSLLLNGFSMETKYKNVENIKKILGVKHVTVAKKYYPDMNTAKNLTQALSTWSDLKYKGEGMVVSIIDTGIDYTHKDMRLSDPTKEKLNPSNLNPVGPGKFFTDKVPYGYNFADDNTQVIDNSGSMHGMHVAGIVAANCASDEEVAKNLGIKGVAPEAQLLAMKVFSNDPNNAGAFSDDIVAAIEDSVAHGADVINMSLGSTASFQDPEDAEQVAIKEATDHGTMVVVSAGNSQYSTAPYKFPEVVDTGLVGSPGLAHESLQVASYENTNIVTSALDYTIASTDSGTAAPGVNQSGTIAYFTSDVDPVGVLNGEYPLVDCGIGQVSDFAGKDLNGKIALIKRGVLSFVDKKLNAQAAGAIGAIIYNQSTSERADGGDVYINMLTDPAIKIPAVFIGNTDGVKLFNNIANVKVSFHGKIAQVNNSASNNMSDFSSWGPTPNLDFKPEITAPGGNIWSTVNDNKYENMSGTSMAAPHTSGGEALILQAVKSNNLGLTGKALVDFAKDTTINTAKVEMDIAHPAVPYSPRRQGAGMLQIENAIKNTVTVTDNAGNAAVALKEIGRTTTFTLNLKNYGNADATYTLGNIGGVLTEYNKLTTSMSYDININGAAITFDKPTVTVPAKGNVSVNVTVTLPDTFATEQFVEGYVSFTSTGSPSLVVPYMGFYGDWSKPANIDAPAWDNNSWFGGTTLLTGDNQGNYYYLGGNPDDGINPDNIAISPCDGNLNAIPYLTLFRNVKDMVIEVQDANHNVVRQIGMDNDLRKLVYLEANDLGIFKDSWGWDGTIYNPASGWYEPAPEGQYYINIRTKNDYVNAKEQSMTLPVKVDSNKPDVEIISPGTSNTRTYNLQVNASDAFSGLDQLMVVINYDFDHPILNGLTLNENTNTYEGNINLNDGDNQVIVFAFDNAMNVNAYVRFVTVDPDGFAITSPADGQLLNDGEVDVNYTASQTLLDSITDFAISIDDEDTPHSNGKNLTYKLTGLAPGNHKLDVLARNKVDDVYNIVAQRTVNITVPINDFSFSFDNLESGLIINQDYFTATGKVTRIPKSFTVNGQNVQIYNDLTFQVPVKLTSGILNKVKVETDDGQGNQSSYAYNVYCDLWAPEINLTTPSTADYDAVLTIPRETSEYTVSGTVQDDMFGYKFYVNGEQVENVELSIPDRTKTVRTFSKTIPITSETTIIELRAVDIAGNVTVKTITLNKESSDTSFMKIENMTTPGKVYHNGEQAKVLVRATNESNTMRTATLIMALYDKNTKKMLNIMSGTYNVMPWSHMDMSGMMSIPKVGNYTVRCFVWDSFEFANPLSDVISIPVVSDTSVVVPLQDIKIYYAYDGSKYEITDRTQVGLALGANGWPDVDFVTEINPSDATNSELEWTSSDPTVATVETLVPRRGPTCNGQYYVTRITGQKPGAATITVSAKGDPSYTKNFVIEVAKGVSSGTELFQAINDGIANITVTAPWGSNLDIDAPLVLNNPVRLETYGCTFNKGIQINSDNVHLYGGIVKPALVQGKNVGIAVTAQGNDVEIFNVLIDGTGTSGPIEGISASGSTGLGLFNSQIHDVTTGIQLNPDAALRTINNEIWNVTSGIAADGADLYDAWNNNFHSYSLEGIGLTNPVLRGTDTLDILVNLLTSSNTFDNSSNAVVTHTGTSTGDTGTGGQGGTSSGGDNSGTGTGSNPGGSTDPTPPNPAAP